jgi:hypothetical protein
VAAFLKGLYDSRRLSQRILVTGSARLDSYRHGGDSLQGRYHLLRMHPFSAGELGFRKPDQLGDLLTLGGFPEPLFGGNEREARRWSREYRNLIRRAATWSSVTPRRGRSRGRLRRRREAAAALPDPSASGRTGPSIVASGT